MSSQSVLTQSSRRRKGENLRPEAGRRSANPFYRKSDRKPEAGVEDIGLIREQAAFQDRHMNMKSAEQKAALRRRTKAFASKIVRFYCGLDKTREEIRVLGKQMLRAGTSVAANHREASRARSSAEFVAKVELCAQEADETQLWLELLRDDCGVPAPHVDPIWDEADQLIAIFVTMAKRTKEADQKPKT